MPLFDECCVLIPASTLEDFPSDLSDYDARSLLAAWTVLWHPSLLGQTEQTPAWYRADAPPDPIGSRLITVPSPSIAQLPDGYEARAGRTEGCKWVTGASRDEMLMQLELGDPAPLACGRRTVRIDDFFAAGFAALQIQVMTRRLRYTSNLDEIHLQNRIVAAAKAFLEGAAQDAIDALHDVFDSLAEERDHYFSSDPHLIDLTLTSESTIESLLATIDVLDVATSDPKATAAQPSDDDATVLATPSNVLIDSDVAQAIAGLDDPRADKLRRLLADGHLGWAGGGPPTEVCLDAFTLAHAESLFRDAHQQTEQALGTAPPVYGRFAGSTPSDMTRVLAELGYCGMIPLDFAGGTGHGDEAKVILQAGSVELEALTAKPIDASSDAAFLSLGARLGESIDSGEIATALLVHWPGQACDAFCDLRRVASWSLSLGRFWKLDDYFRDGERPYHHGSAQTTSASAARLLESLVEQKNADPISSLASTFAQQVIQQHQGILAGMTSMVTGNSIKEGEDVAGGFAAAVVGSGEDRGEGLLLINPHAIGCRDSVTTSGPGSRSGKHVFASTRDDGKTTTTVDIPACGFVMVRGGAAAGTSRSLATVIRGKLFGGPKMIVQQGRLQNEFMEVAISPESGGISGVYSGATRGNRFSMRLVRGSQKGSGADDETVMRSSDLRVITSTAAVGCIETSGEILTADGKSTLATFTLRYTLCRGSRALKVQGQVDASTTLGDDPWHDYFAARVAVVTEAAIYRSLVRDKLHRARSRRLVAPLGVVIDEAERQTLVATAGLPFHRRVGERFLDTLVSVQGESHGQFTLHYGFDVSTPVATARTYIAPPVQLAIQPATSAAEIGWILHAAPKDILISRLTVDRRNDGKLAAIVRVIQTRPKSCKATIRFFRDVECARLLDGADDDPINQAVPSRHVEAAKHVEAAPAAEDSAEQQSPGGLTCKGDLVSLSLASHGVADVLVVFDSQ